ncbi:MAG: right-handed parallel beta-helix repeat-containing protein [Ignavibacteriales bacterium]|nr:right-handed parallel beta-helix repeat-containing protein [Ignavibacteriales bacterium]
MRFRYFCLFMFIVAIPLKQGIAQVMVYVSPTGNDTNPGTVDQPFKSVSKGVAAIGSNGTVMLRGGVHLLGSSKLSLSKTGQANSLIKLWAYPGETPILDCTGNTSDGISISGSYYHLKGFEVRNAGHNGINISGNNNIIENCSVHDNQNTGLHLTVSGTGVGPSNNLILNCDAYRNYDPPIGGNADGFSAKWAIGPGNVFRGCRAFNNSDDGWDLWMGTSPVLIENCYAFRNGVDSWHSGSFNGNGNGFKLGGSYVSAPHLVRNCVSFDNAGNTGRGFDENNNTAGQTLYNCTAYRNLGDNYHFKNTVDSGQTHIIKNCISHNGAVAISSGIQARNSWQGFTVTNADFLSLDTSMATAARNVDGTLPASPFVRLAPGSSMIDAGENIGLPFGGKAPDLGAFETGTVTGVQRKEDVPLEFTLDQNFPNPFNPTTTIRYWLLFAEPVSLRVYDTLGREVAALVTAVQSPGEHLAAFDASRLTSGIYFARLAGGTRTKTIKLVLTK